MHKKISNFFYQMPGFLATNIGVEQNDSVHVVDLRSDTLTKPTPEMRMAMAQAEVGDDCYGEDPTVNELQRRCASLLGKEASLFVPSGIMANLIAVLVHCQGRGEEVILGDQSHLFLDEQGSIAQFAGVLPVPVHNNEDATFDINELQRKIRIHPASNQTKTTLICVESTHNFCGGRTISIKHLQEISDVAKGKGISVHLDGARLLNAAVHLDVKPSMITCYVDSVSMCFSKGLAAPVGSVLAGTSEFVAQARRVRRSLGGGMRQSGVLAAAALYSLDHIYPHLHVDHEHAKLLAEGINTWPTQRELVSVNLTQVQTNIVFMNVLKSDITAHMIVDRLAKVTEKEKEELGYSASVKARSWHDTNKLIRFVVYNDITKDDIYKAVWKIRYVLHELD